MKPDKFYTSYSKLSEIKLITIGLASAELIKYWAEKTLPNGKILGEVINPNTLHHKTFKPLKGGLFCERIFGPLKDFVCACGKPLKYKKEKIGSSFLDTTYAKLTQKDETISPLGTSTEAGKDTKIYNKTSSIFGSISAKSRNYCPTCDVEYTWSVIRRYQLGYINLITPVSHIWYLKGTPSYLSILLDFKKRDLVSIAYCTSTLTIENILKGSIPNYKSGDIVSSWKNLKKQILQNKYNKLSLSEGAEKKVNASFSGLRSNNSLIIKRVSSSPPSPLGEETEACISYDKELKNNEIIQSKINSRKMIKLTKNFNNQSLSPSTQKLFDGLFESSDLLEIVPILDLNSTSKKQVTPLRIRKGEEATNLQILDTDFKTTQKPFQKALKTENLLYYKKEKEQIINLRKLKLLSKLIIGVKKNYLNLNDLCLHGFFPKEILKKTKVNNYILLYLNIFSENKIWSSSVELVWNFLLKKAYKTSFLRLQQISSKFDYLQFKPNLNLNNLELKNVGICSVAFPFPKGDGDGDGEGEGKENGDADAENNPEFDSLKKNYRKILITTQRKLFEDSTLSTSLKDNLQKLKKEVLNLANNKMKKLTHYYLSSIIYSLENKKVSNKNKLEEKNNNYINQLNFLEHIELYTLSKNSTSDIYYLLSKKLSRLILKETNLIGIQQMKVFKSKSEGIQDLLITADKLLEKETPIKYLEILNKLIKLFIKNLLNNGTFKASFFKRYFDYSTILFSKSFSDIKNSKYKADLSLLNKLNSLKQNKKVTENLNSILVQIKTFLAISTDSTLLNLFSILFPSTKKRGSFLPISIRFPIPFPKGDGDGEEEGEGYEAKDGKKLQNKKTFLTNDLTKEFRFMDHKTNFYNNKKTISNNQETELNFYRTNKKIEIQKQTNKLYNNFYPLSYRELWSNDNDWNIIYYYMSSTTDNSNKIIPNYTSRYPNSGIPDSSLSFSKIRKTNKLNTLDLKELNSEYIFPQQGTKTNFFSGSALIQKLLAEYTVEEIKQIDKQNRILLYEVNKQIIKIKNQNKKKLDKSLTKELKQYYKKRDLLIRRTKIVRKIFRKESSPQSLILNVVPVLPPDLRPIVKMGNQIAASDLNRLYQRVIYRNERLKNFLKDSATSNSFEMKYAQRLLQEAVDNLIQNGKSGNGSEKDSRGRLLKSLSDILKGKQGRFRQYLLGKRVDYSGRSVIVVGPKLKLHECGLPKEIALELYLPFLLKRMLNQNLARTIVGAKMLIKTNSNLIYQLLREIMQTSPILLNRAPTLHRLGIQAFQPVLIEGRAILLHPLVCSAFNADFDGDQMAVHVPITVEARAEAWKLMLSRNNILAPSTGDPLAIPSQDMVLGCYYLTTNLLNSKINYYSKKLGSGLFFTKINHVEKAYELKKIDLHANIWLKWSGKIENGLDQEEPIEIRIDSSGKWKEILNKYQKNYSFNNILQNTYILTTVGRVLFNIKIQNCLY